MDYSESTSRVSCDSCQLARINGVICHEHGCPNMCSTWDGERWVRVRACFECGCDVEQGTECCGGSECE